MAQLTVASFNTHWGIHHSGRPFDVVRPSVALAADVLVLQEVWRPNGRPCFADEIAERMGATVHETILMSDRNRGRPRHLQPPAGPPGTAGISIISRLPVRASRTIDLPPASGDCVDQRHALLLTVTVDGRPLTIAGMHASHRLWGSLPQVRAVNRALGELDHPSVLAGDLNMWGPVVGLVLPNRKRAVRGRTWPAHHPHSQIDHLWIDDRLRSIDSGVAPATDSDHRPIWARLETT
jgi:endonuclease/exonuclease/phosphatase family metal-dependent hydrolase